MKKSTIGILCGAAGVILGAVCLLLVMRLAPSAETFLVGNVYEPVSASDAESRDLVAAALAVADDIKKNDFKALAGIVHPEFGVYFSPTATVSLASNKCFTAAEVAEFAGSKTSYVWGVEKDFDAPIEMTPTEYFTRYVFDRDYTAPSLIGVNSVTRSGNALDNVTEMFPEARFIDLLDNGTKEADYADWSVLRLVFEEYNGKYMLTAVIHSEETI